jgi:hypothetical protein
MYLPELNTPFDKGDLFTHLERRMGGHGNGVAWFDEAGEPKIVKGVQLSVADCVQLVEESGSQDAIFHTRLASMGSKIDDNCHPFHYGDAVTCHNGTWSRAADMKWNLLTGNVMTAERLATSFTDSEVIASLVGKFGFSAAEMVGSGVILSLYDGFAKVCVYGSFEGVELDGRWWYASDFPTWITKHADKYVDFKRGTIAELRIDGPVIEKGGLLDFKKKPPVSANPGNGSGNSVVPYRGDLMEWVSGNREQPELLEEGWEEVESYGGYGGYDDYPDDQPEADPKDCDDCGPLNPEYAPSEAEEETEKTIDTTGMVKRRGWK